MRFKQTFEAVNTELGELFPKVFGGGHAYLELTGEDLLDTGVTLMVNVLRTARPPNGNSLAPGKRLAVRKTFTIR